MGWTGSDTCMHCTYLGTGGLAAAAARAGHGVRGRLGHGSVPVCVVWCGWVSGWVGWGVSTRIVCRPLPPFVSHRRDVRGKEEKEGPGDSLAAACSSPLPPFCVCGCECVVVEQALGQPPPPGTLALHRRLHGATPEGDTQKCVRGGGKRPHPVRPHATGPSSCPLITHQGPKGCAKGPRAVLECPTFLSLRPRVGCLSLRRRRRDVCSLGLAASNKRHSSTTHSHTRPMSPTHNTGASPSPHYPCCLGCARRPSRRGPLHFVLPWPMALQVSPKEGLVFETFGDMDTRGAP